MKKRLICVLSVVFIISMLFGCTKQNTARNAFDAYISAWTKKDYKSMYSQLSYDSKSYINEKDFIQKYTNIYDGIELNKITVVPSYPKSLKPDKNGKVSIPFTVTMVTIAGDIKLNNTAVFKEENVDNGKSKKWDLIWTYEMIFPDLKDGEKIRVDTKKGKRGEILDSNGAYLAKNGKIYQVGIVPGKLGANADDSKNKIAQILNISVDSINKELSASYVKSYMFVPVANISNDDTRKNDLLKIPGVQINDKAARVYPLKEKAAQLTGYVQSINADELSKLKDQGYTKNDIIGKAGLEKIYEKDLKAKNGAEIYIVDKNGNKKKTIADKEAQNGKDIKLTIDSNIQTAIYNGLKDDEGSGVAMNPKTGEVLALVSTPSYDPNDFVLGMSSSEWKTLSEDPKKPLSNRFQGVFTPGSSFKPITTAIGLSSGKLTVNTSRNITGLKWQKDSSWGSYFVTRVDNSSSPENLLGALVHSDNIYFAQTALDIGSDNFISGSKKFGIGEKIPFEYGVYSSQISKDGSIKNDIQLADSGYGQGQILMNPVQLASIYTSFVNSGNIINPYLNSENKDKSKVWKGNVFSQDIASTILNDLTQVVADPTGTAHAAYIPSTPLAGKTGTAEIKASQTDQNGTENGWFVAVNTDNPKLLVLEMAENVKDKGGSHYVVPKVKDVFAQFCK